MMRPIPLALLAALLCAPLATAAATPAVAAAAPVAAVGPCVGAGWTEVCVEEDANGGPCVVVWTGMPPSLVACVPRA